MSKLNYGRHLPAFILLFLAKEPAYGSMLLSKMDKNMPFIYADSPAIYRALNDLEKSESINSYWDTSSPGPAKKFYTITPKGTEELKQFKIDIEKRKRNFEIFLSEFENLDFDQIEDKK